MIASNPLDGGKLTMKSMDTLSTTLQESIMVATILLVSYQLFDFVSKSSKSSHIPLHRISN
jgi:hypothetical protein